MQTCQKTSAKQSTPPTTPPPQKKNIHKTPGFLSSLTLPPIDLSKTGRAAGGSIQGTSMMRIL